MAETKNLSVDQLRSIISSMALENAQELAQLKVTNTELQVRLNATLEEVQQLRSAVAELSAEDDPTEEEPTDAGSPLSTEE